MTVLVVGATGGTGSYLVDYLSERGETVIATGRRPMPTTFRGKVKDYVQLDVASLADFEGLPGHGVDACVLLAAAMPAFLPICDPYQYVHVNILGALNVLEYCRKAGAQKVVYAQSFYDLSGHLLDGPRLYPDMPRKYGLSGDHAVYGTCLTRPHPRTGTERNHAYYPVLFPTEEALLEARDAMNAAQVYPRRYFYPSLQTLPYIATASAHAGLSLSSRVLCLPLSADTSRSDVERVCRVVAGQLGC